MHPNRQRFNELAWSNIAAAVRWLNRQEATILVAVLLAAATVWGFAELAGEVMEGDTRSLDEALLLLMREPSDLNDPIGPPWIEEMGRDFTALGGIPVLALVTILSGGFLALQRRFRAMIFIFVAVGGGQLISSFLKNVFERPRPDLVAHLTHVYTTSFPSGHSMMSTVTYLTLGAVLMQLEARRRVKIYLMTSAVLIALVVGLSRVYLGVHWPTDVLAGWTAGAGWALLCWAIAGLMQRKGAIEPDQ